jgi:hypothetical protein
MVVCIKRLGTWRSDLSDSGEEVAWRGKTGLEVEVGTSGAVCVWKVHMRLGQSMSFQRARYLVTTIPDQFLNAGVRTDINPDTATSSTSLK